MKKRKQPKRTSQPLTRKAIRKKQRIEKKVKKQQHYSKKIIPTSVSKAKLVPGAFVKRPADSQASDTPTKKLKQSQASAQEILIRQRQKDIKETNKLKSEMDQQRKDILQQANEEEDKIIKKLEKQLGLNKSKNKNNFFSEDGLDYLLEICDRATSEQIVAAEKHLANIGDESDLEDDELDGSGKGDSNKKKLKSKDNKSVNDKSDGIQDESDNDSEFSDDDVDSGDLSEDDNDELDSDNDIEDDDVSEPDDTSIDDTASNDEEEPPTKKTKPTKDIKNSQKSSKSSISPKPHNEINNDPDMSGDDIDNPFSDDEVSHLSDDDDDVDDGEQPLTKKTKQTKDIKNNQKPSKSNISPKPHNEINNDPDMSGDDIDNPFSDDEVSHLSDDDDDGESDEKVKEKPDVWEDIYGRKRDKQGNVVKEEKGVYIPPHLRNKDTTTDKDMSVIRRQIKSVLNKLTGSNLHWACTSIETVYSKYSRHSVKTALSEEWISAMVGPSATPERFVIEHAALLAALHANVASEIGAHFLLVLATKFDEMLINPEPLADKKQDNLVACLAHLYSFKIFHANLLYDLLTRLLEELSEKNIGSVIVLLRSVGGVLRKDEPTALKNFIQEAQKKALELSDKCDTGSRMKFLLEVLMAIKNNNLNKIPNYDPTYSEQIKKSLKGIIRKGCYITPLNIRLEDLLKADERGKWWVVGSAWEGNRIRTEDQPESNPGPLADQRLLDLARKQRMNTDVRRSIFCVIMSAEDYMDAFEKLQQLGLKGQQEREIVHVLLSCCLHEKCYNPYYAVLAAKLCDTDRKYQLSIQYTVWDKIKELETMAKQHVSNLAEFLIHLFMEKSLPLSVLKVIQFSDLNKSTVKFMRQILLSILTNDNMQLTLEVFTRIASSAKLHMFRESLRLFIQHFLIKNTGKKNVISEKDMLLLKERSTQIDGLLTMHDSKLRF